ncbi:MAG: tubulin-like doman-containing protein [Thermoplasmatota archaeon]
MSDTQEAHNAIVSAAADDGRPPVRPPANEDINRIIIGLGGQGSRVVNEVRKAALALGELSPGIEFMAIDSDRASLANLDSVTVEHRIYLAAPDDDITETVVPWLPREFRPKAGGGCGMQRLSGKGMYLVYRPRILEAVREVARELRQRTQVSNFMVVLVNAFGGGTGSGMLIDFSLDLRAELKEITGQEPLLFGLGILPSRSETIQRANGVAMLKELHFLLSQKDRRIIGGRDYSNPFELYFLAGRELMGIERDDDVLRAITRFTIDLGLIPATVSDTAGSGKGAGWVDLQDIRTLVKGAGHMFATFGYYSARFPEEELSQYFGLLDRMQKIRATLPSLATELETQRRTLDDQQAELGHLQESHRLGATRAESLRSRGILGANRPELTRLLSDLLTTEETIQNLEASVKDAETSIPAALERRRALEAELHECEVRATALLSTLRMPKQSPTRFVAPLRDAEIEYLASHRELLECGTFRSIMEVLGRLAEYHEKTMEVIGKNRVLYLPILNYRMAFQSAALLPEEVLATLARHEFVRYDASGNPSIRDDQLWMVMAMLSSRPENIEAERIAGRSFKEIVERYIARRADVRIVASKSKRFEVGIHSWMVGLQMSPVAPGYPPRLKELEWLSPEYDKMAHERELVQHHAFLYGNPDAFAELASVPIDRLSMPKTNEIITDWWARYVPMDEGARWLQLPPLVAEAKVAFDHLATAITAMPQTLAQAPPSHESPSTDADEGAGASRDSQAILLALAAAREASDAAQRTIAQEPQRLRARLAEFADQLETTMGSPRDASKILALDELIDEAIASGEAAQKAGVDSREALARWLAAPQSDAASPQTHRAGHAREHLVHAEIRGRATEVASLLAGLLPKVAETQRLVERLGRALEAKATLWAAHGGGNGAPMLVAAPVQANGHGAAQLPLPHPHDYGEAGAGAGAGAHGSDALDSMFGGMPFGAKEESP